MTCSRKVVSDILNNCVRPVRGVKPLAYWAYRNDLTFTFSDNEITAIDGIILGSIESAKYGLNAGHELVTSEIADDAYKHKFSAVLSAVSYDLDIMDDIVVVVQENAGDWAVYGAVNGLWKSSQAKMTNDNLGTVAVEFSSRDGMEEEYQEYVISANVINAFPKSTEYEAVSGLSFESGTVTPQSIAFQCNSSTNQMACKLPNNLIVYACDVGSGNYFEGDYSEIGGSIILYIPKDSTTVNLSGGDLIAPADFVGDLVVSGDYILTLTECANITSVTGEKIPVIDIEACSNVETINTPNAYTIVAMDSGLTDAGVKLVIDNAYSLYLTGVENGQIDMTGTTAIDDGDISPVHSDAYSALVGEMVSDGGWTVTYETI